MKIWWFNVFATVWQPFEAHGLRRSTRAVGRPRGSEGGCAVSCGAVFFGLDVLSQKQSFFGGVLGVLMFGFRIWKGLQIRKVYTWA